MKIVIGSDHAGFELKKSIKEELDASSYEVVDCGTDNTESVDYPDFAAKVSNHIIAGNADFGILICGSGVGMSIAANRNPGIRAALCCNDEVARLARQHNNANVLVLGARIMKESECLEMVETFLNTEFEGGRHERRIAKIS